ncbi:MAG: C40 family peptidase [Anaeromyxobacter sp.]|nr:C40 family peptidase [Anaeromyxobacter sp.]MBL0277775.1 C40 family peptidase [Anaeromyxobacter sp.]
MAPHRKLLVVAALAAGCATGAPRPAATHLPPPARESRAGTLQRGAGPVAVSPPPGPPPRGGRDAAVQRALDSARSLVGRRDIVVDGVRFGDGCAALVRAAYQQAGRPLPAGVDDVAALHALARREKALRKGKPAPGDLVFLADRPGGAPEHVGIVERVTEGGTATVFHRTGRGVVRLRVNAGQPWKARGDDGKILNDVLVVGGGRVPVGRLLVAFASLL